MNKNQIQKIQQVEQLIAQAKLELKNWANQISKYHKTLKKLASQLETIKEQITMNKLNTNLKSRSSKTSNN